MRWYANHEVSNAIAAATASRRPLLVDFWDPTCLGCAKLVKTTYEDPRVQVLLADSFVAVKYDTSRADAQFLELNGRQAHVWHPHLVVMDAQKRVGRRIIGYLPPTELTGELFLGAGVLHMHRRGFDAALHCFERAADPAVRASVRPEALYWAGIAAYRVSGEFRQLVEWWQRLTAEHPGSGWAARADCLDVAIPESGFDATSPDTVEWRSSAAAAAV